MRTEHTTLKYKSRVVLVFVSMVLLLVALILVNIAAGSVAISGESILRLLFLRSSDSVEARILWDIRLPRILAAIFLGGALSVSGYMLQMFFRNPIAGPFILGISSGAKLVVALAMVYALVHGILLNSIVMIIAAFLGALLAMCFVLLVSLKVKNMSVLIICGVMIGYICSAITDFVVTFAEDSNIVNLHTWSLGSFSGIHWSQVECIVWVVGISILAAFLCSKPMDAYQMGETYAQNVGVNLRVFRGVLILLSSILAATVTAFAGPISFVGVAVPHVMKNLLKTAKPLLVLPACFLGGAVFCLFCDWIARTMFAPMEISISSVTAIFGAPIVIYAMLQKKNKS